MSDSFDDILNEYSRIRLKNQEKSKKIKSNIYDKYPSIKSIDEKINSLYVQKIKLTLSRNVEELNKIELELLKAKQQKNLELKKYNIKNNYNDEIYDCEKCKDTGFVDGEKCSCFIKKEIEVINNMSNFSEISKYDNFSNLNMKYYNQDIKEIASGKTYKEHMQLTIDNIKKLLINYKNNNNNSFNAIIIGPTGTGKTFLARSIGAEFYNLSKSVLYITIMDLLNAYYEKFNNYDRSYFLDYFENNKNIDIEKYSLLADCMIIDDLGSEKNSEFSISKLFYLLNKRLEDNKNTIITTNLTLNEIKEKYGDAIMSRIYNSYNKYKLYGIDLRSIKNV